jgi:hypothetical protein
MVRVIALLLLVAAEAHAGDPRAAAAEVELSGKLLKAKGAGDPRVWVATGGCFTADMKVLASVSPSTEGKFFAEVFVPQGTKLFVCGALVPKEGKLVMYGTADRTPLDGSGRGEVVYTGLIVTLKKSAPIDPPK